jgi:molybdopterin synthase catalytic subunit
MNIVRVQAGVFDAGAELAPLSELGGGAVASFIGIARQDTNDHGAVTAIELEHYPAMTSAALAALTDRARMRWPLLGCILIHRAGIIPVGDAIVLVGTASLHRAAALESVAYLIDRLKSDVPFWKKEHRSGGGSFWVDAKPGDLAASGKWCK